MYCLGGEAPCVRTNPLPSCHQEPELQKAFCLSKKVLKSKSLVKVIGFVFCSSARPILPGEEVLVNYGYSLENAPIWYREQNWREVGNIEEDQVWRGH